MNSSKYILLLFRKFHGKLKAGEEKTLNQWLQQPDQASTLDQMEKVWELSARYKNGYEPDVNQGFNRFKAKIEAAKLAESPTAKVVPMRRWSVRRVAVAVAVVLIGLVGYWQFASNTAPERVVVQTKAGEQNSVTLPDGTMVVLNENSEVAFLDDYRKEQYRIVEFKGEAYFDIEPNPDQAFIILTDQAEVKVLGTAFNLRAYENELFTEVEVENGKVEFSSRDHQEKIPLGPNDRGVWVHGKNISKKKVADLNAQSWRTNELNFRNTALDEILLAVERHYKVQIDHNNPALLKCQLTFTFGEEDLKSVLQVLELNFNTKISKVSDDLYRIDGGNCDD